MDARSPQGYAHTGVYTRVHQTQIQLYYTGTHVCGKTMHRWTHTHTHTRKRSETNEMRSAVLTG